MEMQMEIKSGWKEEGGQMSLSASAMLGRWETDRCSVQNQFPETSARCAWGDRSFSRSSSAPCGGSTVFWWLTDTIFFGGDGILQRTLHLRRHNSFQRHCVLAVSLLSLSEGGLLLVLYSYCTRNTGASLMLGCFCERLQLCAPQFKRFRLLYNTTNFSVYSLSGQLFCHKGHIRF